MTYMALFVRQCINLELGDFSADGKKHNYKIIGNLPPCPLKISTLN